MAFRTDLAVAAIENHKTAAALPHVRQSDRTLEGFAVHEVRILSEDAAREIGMPARRSARCCASCCRIRMTVRCSMLDWATE